MRPQPEHRSDEGLASIPPELFSAYTSGPFEACSVCSLPLRESGCLYEIQKVFRGREAIFEMAICERCGDEACRDFSAESLETLKEFFAGKLKANPEHCHLCGLPRAGLGAYTVIGACKGRSLITPAFTFCEACGEKLEARLSRKTREAQADFISRNFPGVPGDIDLKPALGPGFR